MAGRLALTTPPGAGAVTLEEAKAHLRVTHTEEDELIARLAKAATAEAEKFTRRSILQQGWTLTLDGFPAGSAPIELPRPPVTAVGSLVYDDGDGGTDLAAEHVLIPDPVTPRVQPPAGAEWPAGIDGVGSVRIAYTAGYAAASADLPEDLRQAIFLIVGRYYAFREDLAQRAAVKIPQGSRYLLSPYRILLP